MVEDAPPARFYIARHGQRTDFHVPNWTDEQHSTPEGRPQDPPLTPEGLRQAACLGVKLKQCVEETGVPITRIICSPFTRCVQTAAGAADGLGIDRICIDWGFAEYMNNSWYKVWDAHKLVSNGSVVPHPTELLKTAQELRDTVETRVDPTYQSLSSIDRTIGFENPETWSGMQKRVRNMLRLLQEHYPGEHILLVGHGATVECANEILCPDAISGGYEVAYASLSIAEKSKKDPKEWKMCLIADTSHY